MGHLGDGTLITTVQDEEIVLTGSNGQTFKMKVTDLAEAVRQVMPVVVEGKKGLINYEHLLAYKGNISDCNKAYHGIYRALPNTANTAVVVINAAIIISLVCYLNDSYKFQLFFDLTSGNQLFWRKKVDAYWGAWVAL